MDIKRFDKSLQILNDQHLEYLQAGNKKDIPVLLNMLDIALKINDHELIGYIYHSLAFAEHFIMGRYKSFLKYIRLAAEYLLPLENQEELMNVYYLIAIDALNRGIHDISYHYYVEARNIAQKKKKVGAAAILDMNIAHIMLQINQYEKSLKLLESCIKGIKKDKKHPHYYSNLASAYLNQTIGYIRLNKMKQASKSFNNAHDFINKNYNKFRLGTLLDYEIINLIILVEKHQEDLAKQSLENNKKLILDTPQIHMYLDQIQLLCSILLKNNKHKWVKEIIDIFETITLPNDAVEAKRLFTNIKIDYYSKINDKKLLEKAYIELANINTIILEEKKKASAYARGLVNLTNTIATKRRQAYKENEELINMIQEDALTGLANRYAANTHLDSIFEKAYKNKTKLGIVYIDVDDLKVINDTKGHLAGDECLKKISKVFKDNAKKNKYFPARYGGDEFVIFFENKTTQDIKDCINNLKKKTDINFSAGIYNKVPRGKDKTWNFLANADDGLYLEKKKKHQR